MAHHLGIDPGQIKDFVHTHGMDKWRCAEARVYPELIQRGGVLISGGGSLLSFSVRQALADHQVCVIYFKAEGERLEGCNQRLLKIHADSSLIAVSEAYANRTRYYQRLADIVWVRS